MRNVARIKLGYYPLPHAEGLRLRKLLVFEDGASAVDPCAGTGAALHQLTEGANVDKHGVELDAGRAAQSAASGITTIHGNLFETIGKAESVSFLYLNPPYDAEIGSRDNKRMEYLFLDHTYRWLVEGGVLLMVVPQERLDSAIPLLAGNFTDLCIFRLTDPEAERFDQVALFGVRKLVRGVQYDHYIGGGEQAHLLSLFGCDAEVGAIRAAIYEKHTFTLTFRTGRRNTSALARMQLAITARSRCKAPSGRCDTWSLCPPRSLRTEPPARPSS